MELINRQFRMKIGPNGAMTELGFLDDPYQANFLLSSHQEPWVPEEKQWGLAFVTVAGCKYPLQQCVSMEQSGNTITACYLLNFIENRFACVWDGDIAASKHEHCLEVRVSRSLLEYGVEESFQIKNTGRRHIAIDEIGWYTSFRDTYTTGDNALQTHMNQHIWMGGDLSYIEAERQSGEGPHMGMITLDGNFTSYQLEEVNTSNHRGIVAMMAKDVRIPSNKSWNAVRLITPYADHRDFEEKICKYTGHPVLDYGYLTIVQGESFHIKVDKPGTLRGMRLDGQLLQECNGTYSYTPERTGEIQGRIYFGKNKIANIKMRVIEDPMVLLKKRAHYIANHQQLLDEDDPRCGAFLPYNILTERIYKVEEVGDQFYSVPDRNDARERLGMGAFLAAYARMSGDMELLPALRRYSAFIEKYIIDENYDVWDSYERQNSVKYYLQLPQLTGEALDMRFRSYNYCFVLSFITEMYWLTSERHYAELIAGIVNRFEEKYQIGGDILQIGIGNDTVKAVWDAGLKKEAERIQDYLYRRALYLQALDDQYEPTEVAYEQCVCGGAMREIAGYYLYAQDDSFLDILKRQYARLRTFEGDQPDYHSYHTAIRHWDDFWFGELELWGDTTPHYWDSISAEVYCMYAKITKDEGILKLAEDKFRNMLSLINSDGSCWYTYLYPEKVNGRPGARYDPLSNDQDWAYYTYLKTRELLE